MAPIDFILIAIGVGLALLIAFACGVHVGEAIGRGNR